MEMVTDDTRLPTSEGVASPTVSAREMTDAPALRHASAQESTALSS
jgi:hypothetical protein